MIDHDFTPSSSSFEVIPTDWALAYAGLAPLVTEARACLELEDTGKALDVLQDAYDQIRRVTRPTVMITR